VLEAAFWNATGSLARFSIQQIIDCSEMEGNEGDTLQYIVDYGIVSDGDYPYRQMESDCNAVVDDKSKQCLQSEGERLQRSHQAHDLDEDDLTVIQENKLSQLSQPVVTCDVRRRTKTMEIVQRRNPRITKLLYLAFKCDGEADHGVLLVGYGIENGKVTGSSGIAGELVGEKADMPGFTEIRLLKKDQVSAISCSIMR
ncbi:hypothetical protein FOL47_009127, partial [Perkinsus chesapeaki]